MTSRERALLRGRDLKPQTEDEAAIKAAVKGGGGELIEIDLSGEQSGITYNEAEDAYTADDTIDGKPILDALQAGRPVWVSWTESDILYHNLATGWFIDYGYLWLYGFNGETQLKFAQYGQDDADHTHPVNPTPLSIKLPRLSNG